MKIIDFEKKANGVLNQKLSLKIVELENLIAALNERELPENIVGTINKEIQGINSFSGTDKIFLKQFKKTKSRILQLLEKELKLVTKNHYRNLWLAVGMIVFGIPIGTAIGTSIGNMAFIGIGMVTGMIIGITIGIAKDKEAYKNGNQLNLEITN